MNNTTVTASQVLVGTEVLFVAFVMAFTGRERYGAWSKAGIVVALAGALLVAYTPGGFSVGGMLFGNLCGVLAAAMQAGYSLIGNKVRVGVSNTTYTFLVYGTSAIVLNLMVAVSPYSFTGYGWINYLCGFLMAVFNSLLGHSIFNWSFKYLSPTLVAVIKLFQPVFSTIWALFLFSELPTVNQLVGGVMVNWGYSSTSGTRTPNALRNRAKSCYLTDSPVDNELDLPSYPNIRWQVKVSLAQGLHIQALCCTILLARQPELCSLAK